MVDVAMLTKQGGRDHNEDYIRKATYEEQLCIGAGRRKHSKGI